MVENRTILKRGEPEKRIKDQEQKEPRSPVQKKKKLHWSIQRSRAQDPGFYPHH